MRGLGKYCLPPLGFLVLAVLAVLGALVSFLSPGELLEALTSAETLFAVKLTLLTSGLAALLAFLLAAPAAYFMARGNFKGKQMLDALLDLPLVMPPLAAGVGLLLFLGDSPAGRALASLGLHLVFSPAGAVLAQAFVASFILLRGAKAAFEAVDPEYEAAAQTLGLNPRQVFLRVTLPMAGQGLLSAAVLAWARAMGEFGATLMVAGATRFRTETLPMAVFLNISSGEPGIAVACALILLALGFSIMAILRLVLARAFGGGGEEGRLSWRP
jgi:molybdate transport system permease protein